ncbi:MAG TPA: class I SAM-dependent methyltransferase [Pirellulales bacterium]|nr:class I SAM-dependent methyltransferase [Pirellulales bacterium]
MRWFIVFGLWAAQSRLLRFLSDRLRKMERERDLAGFFEPTIAAQIWQDYDWEHGGEEWSVSAEWRQSLVENVIDEWLPPRAAVLEIGPGAGRWTGHLHERAERLALVDVAPRCLALCQSRLDDTEKTAYCLGNGPDLSPLEDESIDFAWSFDVFVHLTGAVTASYLRELRRVLRTGGRAVIHHNACVPARGRWRSKLTAPDFTHLACRADLSVADQLDSWGSEREFDVRFHNAVITVLEKR